ncbi:hypothetical protein TNCV_3674621 [Trichonephila clavipes]|nr:hypothetical protein TNCV_3674621 [Trichonephila clavipes]
MGKICAGDKTPLVFVEEGVKINRKVYQRDNIESVLLRGTKSISEMQIGRFNKTLHQFAQPKRNKKGKENFSNMISSEENDHLLTGSQTYGLQCMVHFPVCMSPVSAINSIKLWNL